MDEKKEFSVKSKNYMHYPDCWHSWWDWALPLRFEIETLDKDYFEINVQILCVYFTYTRISHKWLIDLDKLTGKSE